MVRVRARLSRPIGVKVKLKAKSVLSKPEPHPVALRASVPNSLIDMYEPDFESDDNYEPIYPCVFTSYICNSSTPSDDSIELPRDLYLLDSGANIHIVSSLATLESMIQSSRTRSNRILSLDGSDTLTVKGINPKKGLRPTHRHYVESYGHVLVVPGILQNNIF
jgi:hypothetical protein